jgi:tRNA(adenine34) deaminase
VTPEEEFDRRAMALALQQARRCLAWGDVPVGAAVTRYGEVLSAAGNQRERLRDPTAHAEILALRAAARRVGKWRLDRCTLYVTLEPCAMCAGALVLARAERVVFGAADPKAGFVGSLGNLVGDARLNHRVVASGGLMAEEAGEILREFFAARRSGSPAPPR